MSEKTFEKFDELFKTCFEDIFKDQNDSYYQNKWIIDIVDKKFTTVQKPILNQKICKEKIKTHTNYFELKKIFSTIPFVKKLDYEEPNLLEEFIDTYFYLAQKTEFDEIHFSKSCSILEKHITQQYFNKSYFFTPIYDFDTEFEKIEIGEFKIKKIEPKQFYRITSIDLYDGIKEPFIDFQQKKLKYVLSFYIEKNSTSIIDPKKISENILSALRLTTEGSIYFGNFYGYHPLDWQGSYFPGYKETPIKTVHPYFLRKEHIDSFKEIYSLLNKIHTDFEVEKIRYLTYSIRRFEYSYRDHLVEDNITDLMISLETMVNNQPYEVRDKTSLRAAILLEDNDEEKINCKKFIQKCYDIRSEIVHGKKRDTKIKENDKILSDEEIKEKLENYTRKAVSYMLKLQIKFKTQDEVLNRIDRFILNRSEDFLD